MTLLEFSDVFAMLAKQLRQTDADEADIRAYYRAMGDLDIELVSMAAERMAREGGARGDNPHWFPKTSEWRALVAQVESQRQADLAHRLRALHKTGNVLCSGCDDTGWAPNEAGRFGRCECVTLRRLEVLGRRPMPTLVGEVPDNQDVLAKVTAMTAGAVKGMR